MDPRHHQHTATIAEVIRLLSTDARQPGVGARSNPGQQERALSRCSQLVRRLVMVGSSPHQHHADLDQALLLFMERSLHYNCVPQCCNASSIRLAQIYTKAQTLWFMGRHLPSLLTQLPALCMQDLLQPHSTIIAPAAAEALSRSSEGTTWHHHAVAAALTSHPRFYVRDFLLRAVARAAWDSPPSRLITAVQTSGRAGDPSVIRVWQRRALAALSPERSPAPSTHP
ncbi:MAG: hypothetical protein P8R54_21895 [Myxococcota bacterium]|nr:hypothetical protein [Myxococcota bacterium]